MLQLILILFGTLAVLTVLYLLAIMPKVSNRPDLAPFKGRYYAHRGLHQSKKVSPENSMAAFKLAVEQNYGIELDVQLTKDRIPVIFHDYNLQRICGMDLKLCDLTYKELEAYTLYKSTERIPTLKSVLDMVNGRVPLIVEFKSGNSDISVCKESVKLLDRYKGVYCIESFNPLILMWYKKNRPAIVRGQLSSNLIKDEEKGHPVLLFILQNLMLNFLTKPDFVAYNHKYTDMLSFNICRVFYKIPTFAWTIRSNEDLEFNKKYFDYFIFDRFIPNIDIK